MSTHKHCHENLFSMNFSYYFLRFTDNVNYKLFSLRTVNYTIEKRTNYIVRDTYMKDIRTD